MSRQTFTSLLAAIIYFMAPNALADKIKIVDAHLSIAGSIKPIDKREALQIQCDALSEKNKRICGSDCASQCALNIKRAFPEMYDTWFSVLKGHYVCNGHEAVYFEATDNLVLSCLVEVPYKNANSISKLANTISTFLFSLSSGSQEQQSEEAVSLLKKNQ